MDNPEATIQSNAAITAGIAALNAALTAGFAYAIVRMAGIPHSATSYSIWCGAFPFSIFLFSLLTYFLTVKFDCSDKLLRIDSNFSAASIVFLILLLSRQSWENFAFVAGLFYFAWIITRLTFFFQAFRQLNSRAQFHWAAILYTTSAVLIGPFIHVGTWSSRTWINLVCGICISVGIALFIRRTALFYAGSEKKENEYHANFIGWFALLSLPMLNHLNTCSQAQLSVLLMLIFLYLFQQRENTPVWAMYLSGIAAVLMPFSAGINYAGISLLIVITVIHEVITRRKDRIFLEIPGVIVFFLLGFLTWFTIQADSFHIGAYRWPFDAKAVLFSGLLDRRFGILFSSPLILLALIGYFLHIRTRKKIAAVPGPFLLLIIPSGFAWVQNGRGPLPIALLPFTCLLWPFAIHFFRQADGVITSTVRRFALFFGTAVSLLFAVFLSIYAQFAPTPSFLLNKLLEISHLNFTQFFPVFDPISFGWNRNLTLWVVATTAVIILTFLDRYIPAAFHSGDVKDFFFLLALSGVMLSLAAGTKYFREWRSLPDIQKVDLSAKNLKWVRLVNAPQPVWGVEMDSWMSNSIGVRQGQIVGEMVLTESAGKQLTFPIRAGIETAECMYTRPDVLANVQHKQPVIAKIEKIETDDTRIQTKFSYRAQWFFQSPIRLARIECRFLPESPESTVTLSFDGMKLKVRAPETNWGIPQTAPLHAPIRLNAGHDHAVVSLTHFNRSRAFRIVSDISNAAQLGNGVAVCRIRVEDAYHNVQEFELYSGTDTSEWAYDRKDMAGKIRHSKAKTALTKQAKDSSGKPFPAHAYSAIRYLDPECIPVKVTLEFPSDVQRFNPKINLNIYSITFL